jgi:hypothetical protein
MLVIGCLCSGSVAGAQSLHKLCREARVRKAFDFGYFFREVSDRGTAAFRERIQNGKYFIFNS